MNHYKVNTDDHLRSVDTREIKDRKAKIKEGNHFDMNHLID
jgi:hypothetical protein